MQLNVRLAWAVAAAFLAASATGLAQHGPGAQQPRLQKPGAEQMQQNADRGRMTDHARMDQQDRGKMQDQENTRAPDLARARQQDGDIYGYQLMTEQERNEYRDRLAKAETNEERQKITSAHRAEMQTRAAAKGIDLDESEESE